MGFHTRERTVVGLHHFGFEVGARVWCDEDGGFIFVLSHLGTSLDVQTQRAGIEAIRDACNDALVRTDD